MENNVIVCHECGIENEVQYAYCKNCGAALSAETAKVEPHYDNTNSNQTYSYNTYNQGIMLDTIEGVPTEDVATFVGKKSYEIMPKFIKMEITASKIGWCWPAAMLGLLFGPLGSAIWFFYRKMYKIALIFAAIGVISSAAIGLISGPMIDNETLQSASESFYSGNFQEFYGTIEDAFSAEDSFRVAVADVVDFVITTATMIIAGIFGFYWYKRHCVNSINRYRNMSVDPRYYKMGLASVGGTSSGMAVLGVVIMILVEDLINLITLLV